MAKAKKYFPYGYGAAAGGKFEILEVGEVSEDEEDYGMYQKEKIENVDLEKVDIWNMTDHTTFALDTEGTSDQEEDDWGEKTPSMSAKGHIGEQGAWQYEIGPQGGTKLDQYFDERKAKNKRKTPIPKRADWGITFTWVAFVRELNVLRLGTDDHAQESMM